MIPFHDLKKANSRYRDELNEAIQGVIDKGWYIGGSEVELFEQEFASYLNVSHVVTCGSATDGLELTLRALGIGPGDEVIIPDFNWVSAVEAVQSCPF